MRQWWLLGTLILLTVGLSPTSFAAPQCLPVADAPEIQISDIALKDLSDLGIDRKALFQAALDTSVPETQGCWAGATGNFDGQILSVGIAQWNLGQGSLQRLLKTYMAKLASSDLWQEIKSEMPNYGRTLFSSGCLRNEVTKQCREDLLALQDEHGHLNSDFKAEVDKLFESHLMIQIQMDNFVTLVTRTKSDLARIFPSQAITPRQIKWAIDTKVQQGFFPGKADIDRVREKIRKANPSDKVPKLLALIDWYKGLSEAIDQDGVRLDWQWNVEKWQQLIQSQTLSDEQIDLLALSFIRSRVAVNKSGLYQALTFQRRAQIIFGVGSVAGRRLSILQSTEAE